MLLLPLQRVGTTKLTWGKIFKLTQFLGQVTNKNCKLWEQGIDLYSLFISIDNTPVHHRTSIRIEQLTWSAICNLPSDWGGGDKVPRGNPYNIICKLHKKQGRCANEPLCCQSLLRYTVCIFGTTNESKYSIYICMLLLCYGDI